MKILDRLFKKNKPKEATMSKAAMDMLTKVVNALTHLAHSYAIAEGHPEIITEENVDRAIKVLKRGGM